MTPAESFSTNVLVAHQDPLLCAGVLAALRQNTAFTVFEDDVDRVAASGLRIDVVVADYGHAMQLTDANIRSSSSPLAAARIFALTSNDREVDIRRAIEAGIHGYLLLGAPLSELVEAVTMVAKGMRYLGRSVAQRMADSLTRAALTSREIEVLGLVVTGESNKAIARRLKIEVGTVKSHMSAIMTKLGATSRTHAAGIAASRGLVEERTVANATPIAPCGRSFASFTQLA
jgi:DNA-binding NarL/FixJ family response regulator